MLQKRGPRNQFGKIRISFYFFVTYSSFPMNIIEFSRLLNQLITWVLCLFNSGHVRSRALPVRVRPQGPIERPNPIFDVSISRLDRMFRRRRRFRLGQKRRTTFLLLRRCSGRGRVGLGGLPVSVVDSRDGLRFELLQRKTNPRRWRRWSGWIQSTFAIKRLSVVEHVGSFRDKNIFSS